MQSKFFTETTDDTYSDEDLMNFNVSYVTNRSFKWSWYLQTTTPSNKIDDTIPVARGKNQESSFSRNRQNLSTGRIVIAVSMYVSYCQHDLYWMGHRNKLYWRHHAKCYSTTLMIRHFQITLAEDKCTAQYTRYTTTLTWRTQSVLMPKSS